MSDKNKYIGLGIIAGFSFGTASILIRFIKSLTFYDIAFWRLLLGALTLISISTLIDRSSIPKIYMSRKHLLKIFLMGIFLALHFLFFIKSVNDTYILNSTILVNTAPIITLIIAWVIRQDIITKRDIIAVTLAFSGILVISNISTNLHLGSIGDIEALLASLFISMYAILGREIRQIYDESPILLAALMYLSAIPTILFTKIILLNKFILYPKITDLPYIILLAFIPTGIGHTFIVYALKGLKGHEVQLFGLLEPLTASILALIIFAETPPVTSLIGSIFIILGIIVISSEKS